MLKVLVGADRRALPRNVGHAHQQRFESGFLLAERGLQLARLGARFLRPPPKRGAFLGRGALEAGADRVALGPQRLDLGLEPAYLAVERRAARRDPPSPPLAAIAFSTAARFALMKSSPSMAAATARIAR